MHEILDAECLTSAIHTRTKVMYFSSLEPKSHRCAYRIPMVRRPSGVRRRRPQCSNIFFSETAGPIKVKFYVEPPWVGGTKVCSQHLGHMTKMAVMPIYGNNPSKTLLRNQWADFHETLCEASGT